jgi:hypothetical protein
MEGRYAEGRLAEEEEWMNKPVDGNKFIRSICYAQDDGVRVRVGSSVSEEQYEERFWRLLEEQDKVLRSYFAQKGGARGQRGKGSHGKGREHVKRDMHV